MLDIDEVRKRAKLNIKVDIEDGEKYKSDFDVDIFVDVIEKVEQAKIMLVSGGIGSSTKRAKERLKEVIEEIDIIEGNENGNS